MPGKRRQKRRNQRPRASTGRVMNMLLPGPSHGSTHIAKSDLYPSLTKTLARFNTSGREVYRIRQNYGVGNYPQTPTSYAFGVVYFTLNGLDNVTDFSGMFDLYRIVGAEVTFRPRVTQSTLADYPNVLPRLYTYIDYDDAVVPTNISIVRQYMSCIETSPGEGIVRTLVPCCALAAYSGTFTSYASRSNQWLDIASSTVQHYGVKFAIEPGVAAQTNLQTYDVDAVLFVEFKSIR